MGKKTNIAVTLCTLAGGLSVAEAQVMCGDIITTGEVLTSNLNCETNRGLTVEGPGGRLDMGGHTLTCVGPAAVNASGIVLEGQGAVVQKGTVAGCANGVLLFGTGGHQVGRMTLRDNAQFGLRAPSQNNQVRQSLAKNNGLDGFHSIASSGNLFSQNIATNNGEDGFESAGRNDTYTRNVATGNGVHGFFVNFFHSTSHGRSKTEARSPR